MSVVEEMIRDLQFRMPEVMIHVSERCAEFNLILHLQNREEYTISGFPRLLTGKEVQPGNKLYLLKSVLFRSIIN